MPKLPMPIDTNDEAAKALQMLRRFRKQLESLPDDWRRWVVESLRAGYGEEKGDG